MWDTIQAGLVTFFQVVGIGFLVVAAGAAGRWLTVADDVKSRGRAGSSSPSSDRR